MSKYTKILPDTALLLIILGRLSDIIGMLLAVPVTAVRQVFFRSPAEYYRSPDLYREG